MCTTIHKSSCIGTFGKAPTPSWAHGWCCGGTLACACVADHLTTTPTRTHPHPCTPRRSKNVPMDLKRNSHKVPRDNHHAMLWLPEDVADGGTCAAVLPPPAPRHSPPKRRRRGPNKNNGLQLHEGEPKSGALASLKFGTFGRVGGAGALAYVVHHGGGAVACPASRLNPKKVSMCMRVRVRACVLGATHVPVCPCACDRVTV